MSVSEMTTPASSATNDLPKPEPTPHHSISSTTSLHTPVSENTFQLLKPKLPAVANGALPFQSSIPDPDLAQESGSPQVTDLPEEEKHIGRIQDGLDEEETILLATIPKAKVVGTPNYGGIRTRK